MLFSRQVPAALVLVGGLALPSAGDEPSPAFQPAEAPELEADAAFAGTWELVERTVDGMPKPVGQRIVVKESVVPFGPEKGRSTWSWGQEEPLPPIMTEATRFIAWNPTRTPARPWPIIELKRDADHHMINRERGIYRLDGETLTLAFRVDRRLPDDFEPGPGRDVEVWRRVRPAIVRPLAVETLDGPWSLAEVTFQTTWTRGEVPEDQIPDDLKGTEEPRPPLPEGSQFRLENGHWEGIGDSAGITGAMTLAFQLPRPTVTRTLTLPDGKVLTEEGTYRFEWGELTLTFRQTWRAPNFEGKIYLSGGGRTEVYRRIPTAGAAPR